MKCNGSQTTCTARNGPHAERKPDVRDSEVRAVAQRFEAVLFASALKPLAASLGFFGEAAVDAAALSFARGARDGLGALLERSLAREAARDEPGAR
jgi:hypothetical protein